MMEGRKVLVAFSSLELHGLISSILFKDELVFAATHDQALHKLNSSFDLIICSLHFDNGRMYELLKYAKSISELKTIPFLCVQMTGDILPFGTYKGMSKAFDLLGGDLFVQVARWRIEFGDEEAFKKLQDVIDSLAPFLKKKSGIGTNFCMLPVLLSPKLGMN